MASKLTTPWQEAYARSYQQVKNVLLQRMRSTTDEITDFAEGNIFIILISMFAGIAEVIHYYLDNMARETFFVTSKRYSSAIKHAKLVDYHTKAAVPSTVNVTLTISEQFGGVIAPSPQDYDIPVGTRFTSNSGIIFVSTRRVLFEQNTYSVDVPCRQIQNTGTKYIGPITDPDAIIYIDETDGFYAEGSARLTLDGEEWELVTTFAYSTTDDKHFKVEISEDQRPYIIFGDGRFGQKPNSAAVAEVSYDITLGEGGNTLAGEIESSPDDVINDIPNIFMVNINDSTGGSNYENFQMLKDHVPLSIRTLDRAVTEQDYVDIAKLCPGVDKAYAYKNCRDVTIFITPGGGGIASTTLCDDAASFINKRGILYVNSLVLPVQQLNLGMDITVYGATAIKTNNISDDVTHALTDLYSYQNSDIFKMIYLSDIYHTVEDLGAVDHLTINSLTLVLPSNEVINISPAHDINPLDYYLIDGVPIIPIFNKDYLTLEIIESV